jgi:hypothetical protein
MIGSCLIDILDDLEFDGLGRCIRWILISVLISYGNSRRENLHTVEDLKGEITASVDNITEETLTVVKEIFSRYKQMVLDAQGSHTEYVFIKYETPNCHVWYDTKFINVSAVQQ